jgi:ABC-type transport system involved in cytochrome c biogenesis permease subunit
MLYATYGTFWFGVLAYLAATGLVLGSLKAGESRRWLYRGTVAAVAGAALLAITQILRFVVWRHVPLTTSTDSLNLFVVLGTIVAVSVSWEPRRRGLMVLYVPALAALCLFSAVFAQADLAREPRELSKVFVVLHVVTAFLAYALFFIASLTSVAYAYQARRLKSRRTSVLLSGLPSLENMDGTLYHLIRAGYPAFVLTLLMGMLWAWRDSQLLSSAWWLSPKIALSTCMALLYAFIYHARAKGLLRGPKLAHLLFLGFGILLAVYFALEYLDLTNYNFYGEPRG